jgi:hypothetical protein
MALAVLNLIVIDVQGQDRNSRRLRKTDNLAPEGEKILPGGALDTNISRGEDLYFTPKRGILSIFRLIFCSRGLAQGYSSPHLILEDSFISIGLPETNVIPFRPKEFDNGQAYLPGQRGDVLPQAA